jgi:hypothetical protein
VHPYYVLFRGFRDFCEGLKKFFRLGEHGDNDEGIFRRVEYTDSESRSSEFRFFLFVLVPLAAGVLTYLKLYINSH